MTPFAIRRVAVAVVVAAFASVLAVVLLGGGEENGYDFRFELDNALGLRSGSLVTEGGVQIGTVDVELGKNDKVKVVARLDEDQGPIGRDAKLYITSVNLLGQKRLEVDKGDVDKPAPDGAVFPGERVTPSTDLDEVLAVLSPDVRTRLAIVLNEAGSTVVGRRQDIGQLIETLPSTIEKATRLVDDLAGDNRTLTDLVTKSDRVVADVTAERKALAGFVESAGDAAGSVATRRAELKQTIRNAPATLRSLQGFLGELERTTVPLGPAARDLAAVSPTLLATLEQVEPTQKAAGPTLEAAEDVAPDLTRLAKGARPVIKRAAPTVRRLATFAADAVPVTDTLNRSGSNLIGTVDNWSRAVQYRDGLSHIFRGEAGVTPQTLISLINSLVPEEGAKRSPGTRRAPKDDKQSAPADVATPAPKKDVPKLVPKVKLPRVPEVKKTVDDVVGTVDDLLKGITKQPESAPDLQDTVDPLLDFLLK